MQKLHILAIAAHPDDIELSAAGTLTKHAKLGQKVGILDLTQGELGTRGSGPLRLQEAAAAAEVMGMAVRENASMADGFFQNDKEHQLKLIQYIRKYQPDIVIANALEDRHPDHGKGGRLIADACFFAGLRKIETSLDGVAQEAWRPKRIFHMIQDRFLEPTIIVDISDSFEQKMEAIKCYKSQFHDPNSNEPLTYIASQDFLENIRYRASLLGKRIGVRYGEGFICENTPGIADLDKLLLPQMA
ncbi:bacillithiol biosynthesis deacetylase BshB1 [Polluticoccus soli]|uniref:bacillithiol biosynthesis deacetylase BshB1 n=1 Tax=Polluticoccus soli TaxID=3034150 RepID=UPI0023E2739B|nr:bacillithiol biosynthesis deacetylase BshB1 [Flavipsychrobacter sp. JY13-12]